MYTVKQTTKLLDSFHSNRFGFGHRGVAKFFGGNYNAAVFLDKLIYKLDYWTRENKLHKDGSFFYTVQDAENDTYLSKRKQDGLIKKFVKLGLLEVTNRGSNNVRHFKLHLANIHKFLADCADPIEKKESNPTEDKKKSTQDKVNQVDKTKSPLTDTPVSNTSSLNSSSQEIILKDEEEKMSPEYQQELYQYCKEVVGMTKSQAKKTIRHCMQQGITIFNMNVLHEAYDLFLAEKRLSGRITAPHKYFANGIGIALTNLKNTYHEKVKRSEHAVPFYNWLLE